MIALDGYSVERPLGRGRTGEVYAGRRLTDAVSVAIRKVLPTLSTQPGVGASLRALKGECAMLRAPSVMPLLDVIEQDGELYVVEALVEGTPLSQVLSAGPMAPEDVHALAMDLIDGLADLHRQRVVHGDVRPSNVMMTSRGARLIGLGVAHRTKRRGGRGGFLLRDPYDAPEMDAGVASHLTDIYGLGAVLMHAVTGDEGPHDFLTRTDVVMDELLRAMSAAPEQRHSNVEALRLGFTDAEKRRGPVKNRQAVGGELRVTSWGPGTSQPEEAPPPWPEEDDVATPGPLPVVAPPIKIVVEAHVDPRTGATRSVSGGKPDEPMAVSARRDGTLPPGERLEQLLDLARPYRRIGLGLLAVGVVAAVVVALVPARPADMVLIGAGSYPVGDPHGQLDERPGATARVSAFWLDRTEVSSAAYARCVASGKCSPPVLPGESAPELPITGVSWLQAQAFCVFAGRRLPTENEWEIASRRDGRYPWGDASPSCERARFGVLPGGRCYAEGARGALPGPPLESLAADAVANLAGNVWELVDSEHTAARGPGSGVATVAGRSAVRVIKGGAWSSGPDSLRPGARIGVRIDYAAPDVGFRCAASAD